MQILNFGCFSDHKNRVFTYVPLEIAAAFILRPPLPGPNLVTWGGARSNDLRFFTPTVSSQDWVFKILSRLRETVSLKLKF